VYFSPKTWDENYMSESCMCESEEKIPVSHLNEIFATFPLYCPVNWNLHISFILV
jgi:hypothetical protein